jgi:hypothetical protein
LLYDGERCGANAPGNLLNILIRVFAYVVAILALLVLRTDPYTFNIVLLAHHG